MSERASEALRRLVGWFVMVVVLYQVLIVTGAVLPLLLLLFWAHRLCRESFSLGGGILATRSLFSCLSEEVVCPKWF